MVTFFKDKLFPISLVVVMFFSLVMPAMAQEDVQEDEQYFIDVKAGFWAGNEIETLASFGIVNGYGDEFKPSQEIIRGQAANLFTRALELEIPEENSPFEVSQAFQDGVDATYAADIFRGRQDGTFGVTDILTREQMATVIVRAFGLINTGEEITFTDEHRFTESHKENVEILAQYGITTGKEDGSFDPKSAVNRAQFVAFLYRAMVQTGWIEIEGHPYVEDVYALNSSQIMIFGRYFDNVVEDDITVEGNTVVSIEKDVEEDLHILTFDKPFDQGERYFINITSAMDEEEYTFIIPIDYFFMIQEAEGTTDIIDLAINTPTHLEFLLNQQEITQEEFEMFGFKLTFKASVDGVVDTETGEINFEALQPGQSFTYEVIVANNDELIAQSEAKEVSVVDSSIESSEGSTEVAPGETTEEATEEVTEEALVEEPAQEPTTAPEETTSEEETPQN